MVLHELARLVADLVERLCPADLLEPIPHSFERHA